ncbi:hypothetical protein DK846_15105 [Methanospirillum lacunae]|uniref:Uncharacterized protein n=1 Tax=Methanospirillum lacunae TaxID=668570 RepID=A0A2V2MQ49_9EURY|nr:hypothetical protein DK846_15105 [Methanospirillum lacunae]
MIRLASRQNAEVIYTSLVMKRQIDKRAIIVVEGTTDERVFYRFFGDEKVRYEITYNKEKVIDVVNFANRDSFCGLFGIIDCDYDFILNMCKNIPNLLYTDSHDIITMIFYSNAFDLFLREYGYDPEILKINPNVLITLLNIVMPLGIYRLLIEQNKSSIQVQIKNAKIEDFLDFNNFSFKIEEFINNTLIPNNDEGINTISIMKKINENLKNTSVDIWHICKGHDLIVVLSQFLILKIGNNRKGKKLDNDLTEAALRAYYEMNFFISTKLFKSIVDWNLKNRDYLFINNIE